MEFGQADGMVYSEVGREGDALHAGFSFLSSDKDYTIGGLRTVKSGSGSTFQDAHAFNVVWIEVGDTVTGVAVTGIIIATHGGKGLF